MQEDNIINMNANRLQPKRILRAVLFILLLSMTGVTKANPVDFNTAKEVGLKYMNANVKTPIKDINDLQLVTTYNISRGDAAFYVFNISNGFVIVAADDCATPILGYSEEGKFDVENIPIQLQGYLQGFVEQIEYTIENRLEVDERIARQWELVRRTGRLTENRGEGVEPLVTALWSQHCYYNSMCPEDPEGPCGHVLTGCVATAMGLILHYWGYPAQGTGSHTYTPMPYPTTQYPEQSVNFSETTYDWANMPNQLTDTSTQEEIDAVSTLLWHCGVAVDMNYSPYGSGMEGHFTAFKDYFDYSDDMHWEARQDDETWMSMLKADLDFGRPIFYTGYRWANSGHAFVCDGYDVNDRFHFNWGWGGSSNGYFALNANMYFVYDNDAIFNIHPNTGTTHQSQTVNLAAGWNWFSTNLEITLDDLKAALCEALPNAAIRSIKIKSQDSGECINVGDIWVGALETLDVARMYMINVPNACEITLEGIPVNPAEHPVTIVNGVNWIGFPLSEGVTVTNAFAGFSTKNDIVKSQNNGQAQWNNAIWTGALKNLVPGRGYIYKSVSTGERTFAFPMITN